MLPPFTPAPPAAPSSGAAPGFLPGAKGSASVGAAGTVSEVGSWGRPPDRPSQLSLGLAAILLIAALLPAGAAWLASVVDFSGVSELSRRRRFLGVAAFVGAFLSLGYIAFYLRGGPRDPLAPVYWLQGRALSHGELAWNALDPSASFRAGHLLGAQLDRAAGIFPPGFPVLLAAGFLVGAPMLVGPLLAATLLVATWALTREMVLAGHASRDDAEAVARVAVGLSLVSAAMRLHTADALPYGATAVAVTIALAAALRGRRLGERRFFALAGLGIGAAVATQPFSAVAIFAVVMALALGVRARRAPVAVLLASIPGVLLLLAANRAALGHAFASPVAAYHTVFEAPAIPKHPRAVALLLALRAHLADVDNLEPLALLALVPLVGKGRSRTAMLAGMVVGGQMVVAAITSAVPVAGAAERALVAVLPIEHVLVAMAIARLASSASVALPRAALAALALALAGFAVHTVRDHQRMAASDLGRPHYEPDVVRDATVAHGLLYFEDDQGFELAFDPEVPASHGIQAVRMRGDDHDRLLYDLLGHPQIHRYLITGDSATVTAWTPPNAGSDSWRFEAESDWPSASTTGAHVEVSEGGPPCASDGKGLTVTPLALTGASKAAGAGQGTVTLSLPVPRGALPPERKSWVVVPRVIQRGGGGSATLVLMSATDGPPLATWAWDDAAKVPACLDLPAQTVELGGERARAWLVLTASAGAVTLDKTTLRSR